MFVLGETPMPTSIEEATKLIEELAKEREAQKEHARTWEQRAKDNKDAAPERDKLKTENETLSARVKELETATDSSKTEVEKQLEQFNKDLAAEKSAREAAEKAAAADKLTALKTRVGASKGLPPDLIDRLVGDDEETLTADADKLASLAPKGDGGPVWPTLPHTEGSPADADKYIAAIDAALPDK